MKFKLFGKSGLRVSEICLGTMTFGAEWGWGADYEECKKIFDAFANTGANFIDTANRYTEGTSEKYVADFIAHDRDHFVVGTKYTLRDDKTSDINYSGNHRKNMMRSIEGSLKRLKTDYVDIFWLHVWDFTTPIDEIMRGLDDLVRQGKVLYLGISDTPAWRVAQCNTFAELRGWNSFAGLQIEYSLLKRDAERDLIPMANALDLAVTPWAPLAGGALTGKYIHGEKGRINAESARLSAKNTEIVKLVVEKASQLGVSATQLALRWCMNKKNVVIPIIGARSESQLIESLKVLDFTLEKEIEDQLDVASAIELGFPHDFLQQDGIRDITYGGLFASLENHRK